MKHTLKIHESVEVDIRGAFLWYEQQSEGLGFEFIRVFNAGLLNVFAFPYIASRVMNGYDRRYVLQRFPYYIYYAPSVSAITVYGVFHCSQAPLKTAHDIRLRKKG